MYKETNAEKEVVINKNELKVDMELELESMILCGTCMYYKKEKDCIVGVSYANVCIFKKYKKIKKVKTDCCGNYYAVIPRSKEYIICVCKNDKRQKKNVICNSSHFCMHHFIFNEKTNYLE